MNQLISSFICSPKWLFQLNSSILPWLLSIPSVLSSFLSSDIGIHLSWQLTNQIMRIKIGWLYRVSPAQLQDHSSFALKLTLKFTPILIESSWSSKSLIGNWWVFYLFLGSYLRDKSHQQYLVASLRHMQTWKITTFF